MVAGEREAVLRLLEPGETLEASVRSRTRWGPIPFGLILWGFQLVLTDRRLLAVQYAKLTGRPGSVLFEVPRGDRERVEVVEPARRVRVSDGGQRGYDLLLDPSEPTEAARVTGAFA